MMTRDIRTVVAFVSERGMCTMRIQLEEQARNIGWCYDNVDDVLESVRDSYRDHLSSKLYDLNSRTGWNLTLEDCVELAREAFDS